MTTRILYHRWCISVNRERNILKISQSAKWQTREMKMTATVKITNASDDELGDAMPHFEVADFTQEEVA